MLAQHVAHIGLNGRPDSEIWRQAYGQDQIVVTTNAGDLLTLEAGIELHPGLIVIRESGLTRDEQRARLEAVIDELVRTEETLINQLVEICGVGEFTMRDLPSRHDPKRTSGICQITLYFRCVFDPAG